MIKDLPIIVIILPLLSAMLMPIVGLINRRLCWYLTATVNFITFGLAVWLMQIVWTSGRISYHLGGWEPPWGIEYLVDYLNGFVLCVVTFISLIAAIYAKDSVAAEIDENKTPLFYSLCLLFITGLMGMVITGDIFNLYVFLEITSIAGYALIAVGKRREALLASFNYLIMGSIAATFILLGIGYLYMVTGTLNMADLSSLLPSLYPSKVVQTSFAFIVTGLSIKIAFFPLHNWLPNVYTFAPSVVSAMMSATTTKVGAYVLIRITFTVFQSSFILAGISLQHILLFMASLAILAGSILAVGQTNIKKMLAYSSIGQIGYIVLGVSLLNLTGVQGSILHILNHALMKSSMFLVAGAVVYKIGLSNISDYQGLGAKMPFTMAAFTISALSMIGVPLTVGFVSKWYLALASLKAGMWFLIPVILLSSLLMLVYFWRIIDSVWFKTQDEDEHQPERQIPRPAINEAPPLMLGPIVVTASLCIVFGLFPSFPLAIAEQASTILLK